jgi:Fe-S cluster biogenesis protein NfuA
MVDKEKVAEVLDDIRGGLQSHGGDVQLVEVTEDGIVKVVLQGACRGCPMAQMTIKRGVEAQLKKAIPDIQEVVAVDETA